MNEPTKACNLKRLKSRGESFPFNYVQAYTSSCQTGYVHAYIIVCYFIPTFNPEFSSFVTY